MRMLRQLRSSGYPIYFWWDLHLVILLDITELEHAESVSLCRQDRLLKPLDYLRVRGYVSASFAVDGGDTFAQQISVDAC